MCWTLIKILFSSCHFFYICLFVGLLYFVVLFTASLFFFYYFIFYSRIIHCIVLIMREFFPRESHPDNIFSSMETIMTLVLEESEDISSELLHCLLSSVKKENQVNLNPGFFLHYMGLNWFFVPLPQDVLPIARRLGEKVIGNCAKKIKPCLMQEVKSLSIALDDYSKVVASVCQESLDAQEKDSLNASGQQSVRQQLLWL